MKHFITITFLQFVSWTIAFGQPPINERYPFNEETLTVFSSVLSTDSCYYVGGYQTSFAGLNNLGSSWVRFNLDGTIDSLRLIKNDTLGIGLWRTNEIITTLDDNYVGLAVADGDIDKETFLFLKFNQFGDTILTEYYPEFYTENLLTGKEPGALIQIADSTYFGVVSVEREDNYTAPTVFFRLSKTGELMFYKIYYGLGTSYFHILKPHGLVQLEMNRFLISTSLIHTNGDNDEKRHHTKLLMVDTLGNLIDEHTYWEDTLALDCYGLTKTADGGLIYCGRIGRFYPEGAGIGYILYRGQIVKLNADFTVDWKIYVGDYTASIWVGLRNIKPLNDTEFVAVGYSVSATDKVGWLIKFNIDGELIWERKYFKVPHFEGETNFAEHQLYDVDITPDGGFVMVGQATNYYEDNGFLPGQKAWLLKVDKFGCLVPNCQYISANGNPLEIDPPKDTVIVNPPKEEPIIWLYPNPASTNLFYYHHQENFQFGTAYIYNTAGEVVQKWEISANDITYDIDVSQLAAGNYILRVFNTLGDPLQTERFVKV